MCQRTPRTSLRLHSTCHSRVGWFFFKKKRALASSTSRDRVINAPCDPSAPRVLAARTGLHFYVFLGLVEGRFFVIFLTSRITFFVIYIIINTSLTSYHHQKLLSTRHETVKTCQHTKNGQKWLFLRVSKKRAQNGCFWPVLTSSKIDVFLTSSHHQHIKK
jgi:hypothetical protein